MTDSKFDVAKRCPTCQEPGMPAGTQPAPERRMGRIHTFVCANARCKRFERTWIVQVRPDGSIPEPTLNREKSYPRYDDGASVRSRIEAARASADQTNIQARDRRK